MRKQLCFFVCQNAKIIILFFSKGKNNYVFFVNKPSETQTLLLNFMSSIELASYKVVTLQCYFKGPQLIQYAQTVGLVIVRSSGRVL